MIAPDLGKAIEALRVGPVSFTDVGVHLGPARANAKPVVALVDQGIVRAVAKVGVNDLTDRLVRAEAHSLRGLRRDPHGIFEAPEVLWEGTAEGHSITVVTAFTVPDRAPHVRPAQGLIELARAIGAPRQYRVLGETEWWLNRLGAPVAQSLSELAHALERYADRLVIPAASHGDFTKWNVAHGREHWLVWDWERYDEAGIWGTDLLHWHLFDARTGMDRAVDRLIADRRSLLSGVGLDADAVDITTFAFLSGLAMRFTLDRQVAAPTLTRATIAFAEGVLR